MIKQDVIVAKATELYSRYGIRVLTMDDIASGCGISKKTLYTNFENKYELVQVSIAHITAQLMAEYAQLQNSAPNAIMEVLISLNSVERLFKLLNYRMLNDLEKYYYNIWRKVDSFKEEVGIDFIAGNIKRGQREGLYHGLFDNATIARMRLNQFDNLHKQADSITDMHTTLQQTTLHYLTGLATKKGLVEIKKYQINKHSN